MRSLVSSFSFCVCFFRMTNLFFVILKWFFLREWRTLSGWRMTGRSCQGLLMSVIRMGARCPLAALEVVKAHSDVCVFGLFLYMYFSNFSRRGYCRRQNHAAVDERIKK